MDEYQATLFIRSSRFDCMLYIDNYSQLLFVFMDYRSPAYVYTSFSLFDNIFVKSPVDGNIECYANIVNENKDFLLKFVEAYCSNVKLDRLFERNTQE